MIRTLLVALAAVVALSGCVVVPAHGWYGGGYYGYYRSDHGHHYSDRGHDYYRGGYRRGHRGRW